MESDKLKRIALYEIFNNKGERIAVFFDIDIANQVNNFLNGKTPCHAVHLSTKVVDEITPDNL